MQPKVSVIIPVCNVEKYLPKCLDSILNQTLKEIEVICVDDGSTDSSARIIQEYAKNDDRIHYIYQKNKGVSEARNTGLKEVKSPYLMWCDPDDWYAESMCEKMYHVITENNVDMACCGTNIVYFVNENLKKADEIYYQIRIPGICPMNSDVFSKMDVSLWNKIFKKSIIDKYGISFPAGRVYEDACFFFKYASVIKTLYCVPEKLYYYVRRSGSIMDSTFSKNTKALDHIKIMYDVYRFFKKNNLWLSWKQTFLDLCAGYYLLTKKYLPEDKKELADTELLSLINKLDLTSVEKKQWLKFCKCSLREIKIGWFKILKIKNSYKKSSFGFLGVRLYSRKIKNGTETFSILYIPIYKKRRKNEQIN